MKRTIICAVLAAVLSILPSPAWAFDPNVETMAEADVMDVMSTPKSGGESSGAYSSPMVVHATSFLSDGGAADQFFVSFSGGYLYGKNGGTCMMAPVYLPIGCEITWMYITIVDNDATDLTVQLRRQYVSGSNASEIIASVSSSGASTTINSPYTSSITNPVVSSQYYNYFFNFCLPDTANIKFFNARLYYTDG